MQFSYKGWDGTGRPTAGTVEAASREEAVGQLTAGGVLIAELKPQLTVNWQAELTGPARPTLRELAGLCSQLSLLLASGVAVLQALRVLAGQGRKGALGRILTQVANDVEGGSSLSQALYRQRKLLPSVLLQVVTVAELSGSLDVGLRLLGRQFEQEDHLRRRVRAALTYPAVVVVAAIAVVSFMVTFVVPRYAGLFSQLDAQLPVATLVVLHISDFIRSRWYLLLALLLALSGCLWLLLRLDSVRLQWGRAVLHLPIAGEILLKRELARLTRTLATLMHAGVPILSALEVAEGATGNRWLAGKLRLVTEDVRGGGTLAGALRRHGLLPGIFMEMVAVGEVVGDLVGMLSRVGDACESDVNLIVDRLTSTLEPVLVVVLGLAVVSVIVPIILPMFDIYEHLNLQ